MPITFQNQNIRFTLREKTRLRTWIAKVVAAEKKTGGQLNFVFTDDEQLLDMNIRFLDHDTLTDIITFDYSHDAVIEGDIVISVPRVNENAEKFGVTPEQELRRVMIHGVLHLCGYKDKTRQAAAVMRGKEDAALKLFKRVK